jgi:hypothetical protein
MLPTNPTWSDEIKTLKEFNCDFTDTLEVKNNRLVLTKGNFRSSSYYPLKNAPLVAKHIETLISETAKSHFETLKTTNDYEKISEFNRDLTLLIIQLKALARRSPSFKKNMDIFSGLDGKTYRLRIDVELYNEKQPKPELKTRVQETITHTERTSLSSITCFYPEGVPLQSTLNAAKTALRLGKQDTKWRSFCYVAGEIGKIALIALAMIPATCLTLLKFIVWNPIEYWIRGEIQTRSPFQILKDLRPFYNTHRIACQLYIKKILLNHPLTSKEVISAFKDLAPHAETLDLSSACIVVDNESELTELGVESFNGINYPYPIIKWYSCRFNEEKRPDNIVFYPSLNFISKSNLLELLKTAKSSPSCKEIDLSIDLLEVPFVHDWLKKNSYKYKKREYRALTFIRKN